MQIFVYKNGQQLGPYLDADLKNQLATGMLTPHDMVWWEGQAGWAPVEQTPLMGAAPAAAVLSPPMPAGAGAVATSRTSGLAIASLVCGLSMFIVGLTFIPAIVCGHMGLSEIRRNPGMKGRGMAIGGLILGYMFPVFIFVAVVAISVLIALGQTVRGVYSTINSQEMMQTNDASDTTTNTSDATNTVDTMTSASPTNAAPDTTTNPPAANQTPSTTTNAPPTTASTPSTTTNAPTTDTPPTSGQ